MKNFFKKYGALIITSLIAFIMAIVYSLLNTKPPKSDEIIIKANTDAKDAQAQIINNIKVLDTVKQAQKNETKIISDIITHIEDRKEIEKGLFE